ncbi:MAG: hypothetical protein JWL60_2289 [Gemmatimonadetes bacterium]|nr:hypothetical protein [Gemmatimonadota bacterium]
MTTIADWLSARTPRPPDALRARLDAALGADLARDASEASDRLLAAGEALAAALLRAGSTSRGSALDLLAADALVTYAFEAASESPADIAERATAAMARIASLGAA